MVKGCVVLIIVSALVLTGSQAAQASGFGYYEHSPRAAAMASAFVALADDPSAIYYNPAGLVYITQPTVMFSVGSTNLQATAGGSFGTSASLSPLQFQLAAYYAQALGDRIHVGIGVFTPFTMNNKFDPHWAGRYRMLSSEISSRFFRPAIAIKVSDKLALGAGVDIVHGYLAWNQDYDFFFFDNYRGFKAAQVDITSSFGASGTGYGFSLGALYRANDRLRFGARYQHGVEIDLTGQNFLSPALDSPLSSSLYNGEKQLIIGDLMDSVTIDSPSRSKLVFPAELAVGVYSRFGGRLGLLLDILWTRWSSVEEFGFVTSNDNADYTTVVKQEISPAYSIPALEFRHRLLPLNWDDTISLRLGAEYVVNEDLVLRAGYAHLNSAGAEGNTAPVVLDADSNEITAGFGFLNSYGIEKHDQVHWQADVAFKYAFISDLKSTEAFVADYQLSDWSIVIGIKLRFGMKY